MKELVEKLKDKHYDWFDIEVQLNIWNIFPDIYVGHDNKLHSMILKENIEQALIEVDFLKHR